MIVDTVNPINVQALRYLKRARPALTPQQFRTIKGQILSGDSAGAMRGLKRVLMEKRVRHG